MSARITAVMAAADQHQRACITRAAAVAAFAEAGAAWSCVSIDKEDRVKAFETLVLAEAKAKEMCRVVRETRETLVRVAEEAK